MSKNLSKFSNPQILLSLREISYNELPQTKIKTKDKSIVDQVARKAALKNPKDTIHLNRRSNYHEKNLNPLVISQMKKREGSQIQDKTT